MANVAYRALATRTVSARSTSRVGLRLHRNVPSLWAPRLHQRTAICRASDDEDFDPQVYPKFTDEPSTSETAPVTATVEPMAQLETNPPPVALLEAPSNEVAAPSAPLLEAASDEMSVAEIKGALLDSLYGTERGLAARSEVRAEINELITQLEANNPTPSPTDSLSLLDGNWRLVYTSSPVLLTVLSLSRLPLVTIGDLTQYIDTATNTVENKVQIQGPLSSTSLSTTASFEVRSPKRLQFKLEKGTISTPSLIHDIEIPPSVTLLGQAIDLTDFNAVLKPVSEGLNELLAQAGNLIAQAPALQIPLQSDRAQTWQLNTYVDKDLRIMRGDGGSVFIAVKQE